MKRLRFALCAGLLLFSTIRESTADIVTIEKAAGTAFPTGAEFNAISGGLTSGDFTVVSTAPGSIPHVEALISSHPSAAPTATATHEFELTSDFSSMDAHFDHIFKDFTRTAVDGQRATAEGHIEFKVDAPAIYAIDGMFGVTDVGGGATPFGKVEFEVMLLDLTAGAGHPMPIFESKQTSMMTTDELLMVGDPMGGDTTNTITGSPMGLLEPGKVYGFKFLANTLALPTTTASATAAGDLRISFTSAVPEPNAMILLSMGLGVITMKRRRRSA